MGRKPAPQPLALSGSGSGVSSAAHDDPPTAETASRGVSPADSRSPKSPRSSPFHARFSPLKKHHPQTPPPKPQVHQPPKKFQAREELKPQSQSQSQSQPQSQSQSQSQSQPQPIYRPHDHQDEDHDTVDSSSYPPISSAFDNPPDPSPVSSSQPSSAQTQAQSEGKKSTKNGFFHFNKASKSSNHSQPHVHHHHHHHNSHNNHSNHNNHNHGESRSQMMSRGKDTSRRAKYGDPSHSDVSLQKPIAADPSRSDLSVHSVGDHDSTSKKTRQKPFGKLSRTRSVRDGESASASPSATASPRDIVHPSHSASTEPELYLNSVPLRTAPINPDRSFREMMSSAVRNRSEDRAPVRDLSATRDGHRERESKTQPSSLRENGGSNFLSGLRNSSTRAADIFSKGLFGKSSRSGSTTERELAIDDENYQLKVINLPLVEQTRLTRISKRLEDSRDKTEFWMPAFPWRAIDYLNYKGCEVEGLYRVPGSGPQIKKWQRRFDERFDVNLFEEDDLYDINIIGSMLKAWLRELPDELFPKAAQERVARECAGADKVPDMLIEELSNLSPFNYYLLFAITCHLSLLLAHSDKNKMDFRNLCICFQPCMKIDAFCFKFLVCEWRDCWKGCKNESKYIEEEYLLFDQPPPRGVSEPQKPGRHHPSSQESTRQETNRREPGRKEPIRQDHSRQEPSRQEHSRQEYDIDRQQLSSSDSSKQSGLTPVVDSKSRPRRKPLQLTESNGSIVSNNSSISTTLTINSDRDAGRGSGDLRPLSPIKPLSPLGF